MTAAPFTGTGIETDPWVLKTPSLGSEILMHRDEAHVHPSSSARSVRQFSTTTSASSPTCTPGSRSKEIGFPLAMPTSKSRPRKARSRRGRAPKTTPLAAGTGSRRDSVVVLATTSRPFSRPSDLPRSNTTPGTIGCGLSRERVAAPNQRLLRLRLEPLLPTTTGASAIGEASRASRASRVSACVHSQVNPLERTRRRRCPRPG